METTQVGVGEQVNSSELNEAAMASHLGQVDTTVRDGQVSVQTNVRDKSVSVVLFEANQTIQVQSSITTMKKGTHAAVNIVEDGTTSQNTPSADDLRCKGGPNRLSKENQHRGIQLQKGTTQRSALKAVLKDWMTRELKKCGVDMCWGSMGWLRQHLSITSMVMGTHRLLRLL
ncbi:hypothetical protein V6N13_135830 [Hibiscus sabdariffa]|uniref:Uncharacterized protein n=2 Tax=Hibiscus sabdariffa TaxID=183260 RepID=A0ABR2ANL9_9ROSI